MTTAIRMVPRVRKMLNDRIYKVSGNIYFDSIGEALEAIDNVLCGNDFDRVGFLTVLDDSEGRITFDLVFDEAFDVDNSMLVFVWYRMPSGRYEITAYIS